MWTSHLLVQAFRSNLSRSFQMKSAFFAAAVAALFGLLLADFMYASSIKNDVMSGCPTQISYDKSGDAFCPQGLAKNENE